MIKSFIAIAILAISAQVSAQMMNIVHVPDFPAPEQDSNSDKAAKPAK